MVVRLRATCLALLALVLLPAAAVAPAPVPSLVVMLTIDQLRADELTRWAPEWTGGFHRLVSEGANFPHARQDHAITQTAPGHATLLSGRYPVHTGVPANNLGVGDNTVTLVDQPDGAGASPRRFKGSTLVDWLQAGDPGFRFLSVSPKDRAAILMIGKSRGPVFWFAGGQFTTSTYYDDTLPAWVREWNARRGPERLEGTRWDLLLPDSAYPERDDQPWENGGHDTVFPHLIPADSGGALKVLGDRPWMDSLTLDFALAGVKALGLGTRGRPDLLAVSLSATDYIGHTWGPDSRELHDHLLRLDRWLGTFFDSLATVAPGRGVLVVLSADHGVTPFPELALAAGRPAGRIPLGRLVQNTNPMVGNALQETSGLIYADTARLRAAKVSPESLATALVAQVQKLPGVVDAWTPATLGAPLRTNVGATRWRRSLPRDLPWLVCAVAAPGYIWSDGPGSTSHGTTNTDDVNVPIVFLGPGIRPGTYGDSVSTVDIAPTLAKLLAVKPSEKLDGRVLKAVLK
jgi:Type I phosphodiesterase / nucleotide pyrophosphatase